MTFHRQSQVRRAYLSGWRDRRKSLPSRADSALGSDLYVAYLEGWQDGKRIVRVAKPAPLPVWISDLIDAEDEARW